MAGLRAPLPTLRRRPRGNRRTARGRCGSLLLHRSGLSPPTPCRSPRRTPTLWHAPAVVQAAADLALQVPEAALPEAAVPGAARAVRGVAAPATGAMAAMLEVAAIVEVVTAAAEI